MDFRKRLNGIMPPYSLLVAEYKTTGYVIGNYYHFDSAFKKAIEVYEGFFENDFDEWLIKNHHPCFARYTIPKHAMTCRKFEYKVIDDGKLHLFIVSIAHEKIKWEKLLAERLSAVSIIDGSYNKEILNQHEGIDFDTEGLYAN